MAVTATNLIQGPGVLYSGVFGATEPTDAQVNTTPATSAWTDTGGTKDGLKLVHNQEFAELTVDQIVDVIARRLTKRELTLETNLAEPTLANLALATNNAAPTASASYAFLEPANDNSATQLTYKALIVDGYAPQDANGTTMRRRVIVRKGLSTDNVEYAYGKGDQTVFKVKWSAHFVSSSIRPFRIIDQTA
ncbi:hypothetical protein Aph01nite_43830 [Acrocarpospora phusangensis]|uniref:Uncharacterized protein n=1 Tax=Acrocarpospora phusangensis TaxID=1070424 RepID=A0A919UQ58_9ACTN|nr:hypothetical protein [Acrocarpospora phusangensis]GIH26073.1 hypothetical protein Aph01nite_43830 [Acrocarpospora phusangensis]